MTKRSKDRARQGGAHQPPPASPFAGLAGLRDQLPPGKVQEAASTAAIPTTFAAKVVLSRERKGRGGKTVTVLNGVLLTGQPRAEFMRELSKALGTNVREEGDAIILAGDQRERARTWLEARGARRVVTSG